MGKKVKAYMLAGILCNIAFFFVLDVLHFHQVFGVTDSHLNYFIKYLLLIMSSSIIIYSIVRGIHSIENKFENQQNFLFSIANTVEEFVIILDKSGRIQQINKYCENETGYSLSEIKGKYIWDVFIKREEKQRYIDIFKDFDIPSSNATNWVIKDGTEKYIQWANSIIENENGDIQHILATGVDITERRKMEEKLKRHKEAYEQLVEFHPDPIIAIVNEKIYYYNYTALDFLESSEKLFRRSIFEFIHPKDKDIIQENFMLLMDNNKEYIELDDFEIITAKGNVKKVEGLGICNFVMGKEVVQLVIRDVTEKRKTEELLQKSDKLAVIGQLAAGIAHEIRNPLTSIHGFLKVIHSQITSDSIKEYINITLDEVNRINSVTNELLFLAKPQEEVIAKINLSHLLKDVIHFINSEAKLKNITIETKEINEAIEVTGTSNHLKQAFLNILKNSIDAMPLGGVIRVTLHPVNNYVDITVSDQGMGIPVERLKHIGEPFYSLKENGTGLGLMITKKIIKEHHGTFEIDSAQGMGTTVRIKLPLVEQAALVVKE